MANGKVTLAELRREAERVAKSKPDIWNGPCTVHVGHGVRIAFGAHIDGAREKAMEVMRALPDGALKEG